MTKYAVTGVMRVRCACDVCDWRGWVRDEVAADRVVVEVADPVDLANEAQRKRLLRSAEDVALDARNDVEEVTAWEGVSIEEIEDVQPSPCAVMRASGAPMLFEEVA